MSVLSATIPLNGVPVATDTMQSRKVITAGGTFAGDNFAIEVSPDGITWDVIEQVSGRKVSFVDGIAFEMRARRIAGSSTNIEINVAADLACDCAPPEIE